MSSSADILVLGPQQTQRITGNAFEFPFNLIGKSTMAFLTGQSWRLLKSWYTGGKPEQGFWRRFADGLNRKFSFVCDAG